MEIIGKDIIELPKKILEISKEFGKQNSILDSNYLKNYDLKEIKPIIEDKVSKYNYLKSIMSLPIETKIIANYDNAVISKSIRSVSQVENSVTRNYDSIIWLKDFYMCMISNSISLTFDEAIYIVQALFYREKEINIANELSVCKKKLQKIKLSALIKTYHKLESIN